MTNTFTEVIQLQEYTIKNYQMLVALACIGGGMIGHMVTSMLFKTSQEKKKINELCISCYNYVLRGTSCPHLRNNTHLCKQYLARPDEKEEEDEAQSETNSRTPAVRMSNRLH